MRKIKIHTLVKKLLLAVTCFILLMPAISGQLPSKVFHYYTADNGLSQNMVDCIIKDSRGFMWFGTWNGLNRFDGYEFDVYKYNPLDSNSIINNFVHDMSEDHFGNIWIATNLGLNVYLFDQNRFKNFRKDNRAWLKAETNIIVIMTSLQGELWIGTEKGLFVLKPLGSEGNIKDITGDFNISALNSSNISALFEDYAGNIWIGCENGNLFSFNRKDNTLSNIQKGFEINPNFYSSRISSIFYSREEILWVGAEGNGLLCANNKNNTIQLFTHNPEIKQSIAHNTIQAMARDVHGNMLFGTLGGLSIYNGPGNDFTSYRYTADNKFSISNDFVNSIYADEDGYVWIGTERGGVNKYNIERKQFESLDFQTKDNKKLSHDVINSIYKDKQYLWIGTAGGGLNRFDERTGNLKVYSFDPHDETSLESDFVTSIFRDKEKNMWIGTWGGGVHKLKPKNFETGIFESFQSDPDGENSPVNSFISSIAEDKNGNLWIGTLGGLDVYNPGKGSFIQIHAPADLPRINEVGCLLFDHEGNLWIGTIHGLYLMYPDENGLINIKNPGIRYYKTNEGDVTSISGNYVISIHEDTDSALWFGTYGNGFNKLINKTRDGSLVFKRYTEQDELANNIVYCILSDGKKNLWMSTDNGLSKFNTLDEKFNTYYTSDGLVNNQFYWSAGFRDQKGKMYFGGMKGLDIFYPDSIVNNKVSPNLVLTGLKIYSQPVQVGYVYDGKKVLSKSIATADQIVLSYRSKEFTIEFSALHYDQPEKNKYKYKLENFDKHWNQSDAGRRYATYSNLPGGDYIFRVQATNNDGVWSKNEITLNVKIIPPFYKTWWFIIGMVLLSISATLTYIRLRLNSLKKQKILLEQKVVERTARIEEQKEELEAMAENLLSANNQLENTNEKIEEQKNKVEKQNEEILQQRDRLIEMNKKVQAANQHRLHFFTNISHEFRTPLTLILSPLEQLVERTDIKFDVRQKVQLMYKNARRLLNLINQLMELRKVETGKLELRATKDDIVKFVTNISQSFHELSFKRNLTFQVFSKPGQIVAYFDHEKIENIVYNLLSNAFKYTPEGGVVTLEISETGKAPFENSGYIGVIEKSSYKKKEFDKFIGIKVSDSGIGIDNDNIKEVFKMFYREPSIEGTHVHGTGIGLSLVKEIVKAHRGLLFAKSEQGTGSSFIFLIPKDESYLLPEEIIEIDEKVNPEKENTVIIKQLKRNTLDTNLNDATRFLLPRILIVEDNADMRSYIADQLQHAFRIVEARDGKEGVKLAKEHSPQIIISDIMMPVMDGIELCTVIKSDIETSHIPVILLTSKSGVEDHITGFDAGADDYVPKPFNINILESRIKNILKSRDNFKKMFTERILPEPKKVTSNAIDETFLKKAINIINNNYYHSDFTVEKFASSMNMSRSLLHKKLVAIVGNSAIDFITSIRMKNAISLLLNAEININEVAYKVGFNDPKYFSRCFKKIYGKTPTEFLKET